MYVVIVSIAMYVVYINGGDTRLRITITIDTVTKYKDRALINLRDKDRKIPDNLLAIFTSDMMHWTHFFYLALNSCNSRLVSKKIVSCLVRW